MLGHNISQFQILVCEAFVSFGRPQRGQSKQGATNNVECSEDEAGDA
jgi:hypothetical protein